MTQMTPWFLFPAVWSSCVNIILHHHRIYSIFNTSSLSFLLFTHTSILFLFILHGIQFWGPVSTSNIKIPERFQGKVPRMITNAPWYVPNMVRRQDLQITSVKEEIHRFSTQYRTHLYTHPNSLTVPPDLRRLRRHLSTIFHE
jgi:hypothetical protein